MVSALIFIGIFIGACIAGPVVVVRKRWRKRKDGNGAQLLRDCANASLFAFFGSFALLGVSLRGTAQGYALIATSIVFVVAWCALSLVAVILEYRSAAQNRRERSALGLEPRRPMIPIPALRAIWTFVCPAYVGLSLLAVLGISVLTGYTAGDEHPSTAPLIIWGITVLAVIGAGYSHIKYQQHRIRREDARLTQCDRQFLATE